jgi:hypothetical protein
VGKMLASFCCQVEARFPDMFGNFYFSTNDKIAKNLPTTGAKDKISTYLESLEFFLFMID